MSNANNPLLDPLATIAAADIQRATAQLAQEVFAEVFRRAAAPEPEQLNKTLTEQEARCISWCEQAENSEGQLLRLAMLISGLDQWGLAYTQTFGLTAIPPLTALIAGLRTRLNAEAEAIFLQFFELIEQGESNVVDFKVALRRGIHLALWHAMAACDSMAAAENILRPLGGMLLALNQQMPEVGWRLTADTLAHIQIGLLDAAGEVARESTQMLFESLRHAMPLERYQSILRLSSQAVLAWQQAQRSTPLQ